MRDRDSVRAMASSRRFHRSVAALLIAALTLPSLPLAAQQATIRVTRIAQDRYAVSKSEVVITTKYCHEYSRDEEAIVTTREEGADNAILFASGAQCEMVSATKPDDSNFSLLDFLIQLGLMIVSKGTLGTPKPMPKRN